MVAQPIDRLVFGDGFLVVVEIPMLAAALLLGAARAAGANLLVSGAFGHPRLQEFVFGGTTRSLLQAASPSLFLSH